MEFHQLQKTSDSSEVPLVLAEEGFHCTLRPEAQNERLKCVSTNTFCRNRNTCYLTSVNFITEDILLRYTYLYVIRMVTNQVRCSIIRVGKERIEFCFLKV